MVKDIKYIIKRIIIGTGIAIALMCIKGNFMLQGHALQAISSWQMTAQESGVNNTENAVIWYTNNTPFANQGDGELLFTFSIYKINGISTAPNVAPRFVRVHTGGEPYVCYIGSSTLENSTFNGGTYSAICPMHIESAGVTSVTVALQNNTQNDSSQYVVRFNGLFTWKRDTEYTLLDAINNKLNNIGNSDVISNNNQNTQNIINNQNSNKQDIINNQNSNTDKEIESQKVCTPKSLTLENGGIDGTSGSNIVLNNRKRSDYISVLPNKEYKVSSSSNVGVYVFEYDSNHSFVRYYPAQWANVPYTFTTGNNAKYVRFVFNNSTVDNPVFTGCSNGNQAIVDSQNELNNTLKDDSGGEVSSSWFDEFRESSSTPVSDLLTMPITLLQAYLNGFSGNCQAMNLGQLYGSYIIIPCLNIESYLGHELWSLIDVIFTLFMLYNIGMLCVTIYEGITSLSDDMQFLYSPRHAGAGNTRVERYGDDY